MTNRRDDGPDDESVINTAMINAAVLAQTGRPTGPKPTSDELQAWAQQTLSAERRAQVDSHIAHDPATFDNAMACLELSSRIAPAPARWPLALAATAVLALVGASVFLNRSDVPNADPPASPDYGTERGARTPALDWRAAAFHAGLRQDVTFAPDALNFSICVDGDRCPALAQTLFDYGQVLASMRRACTTTGAPAAASIAQLSGIERVLRDSFEVAPWADPLARNLIYLNDTPASCVILDSLMEAPTGTP